MQIIKLIPHVAEKWKFKNSYHYLSIANEDLWTCFLSLLYLLMSSWWVTIRQWITIDQH